MITYLNNALIRTFSHEGVYSNHDYDPGGETIWGISRYWHPSLDLWPLVDQWDKEGDPPDEVIELVTNFYKGKIWIPYRLEDIAKICPELSYSVFDTMVHLWADQAIPFLQLTINKAGKAKHTPLVVDGWIGDKTLAALEKLKLHPKLLVNTYGIIRGNWYLEESRWDGESPGFINRINFL